MSGYVPLLAGFAILIAVAIKGDLLTTIVGILAAVMLLCTSAIVFTINRIGRRWP